MIRRIRCLLNPKYAEKYYSLKYRNEILLCHPTAIFKGRTKITDPGNFVVGRNVTISAGCNFISEGGIYIQDGASIGENVTINTVESNYSFDQLNSANLNHLFSVVIDPSEVIQDQEKINFKKKGISIPSPKNTLVPDFFVVSTGRSGTKAISEYLNSNEEVSCIHEAKFQLNRISTEYAHGFKSAEEVQYELEVLYWGVSCERSTKKLVGECDLKNSNLIPFLRRINPNAKFIWLIRRADSFVASAYGRRWFDEYEYTFPIPVKSADTSDDFSLFSKYRMDYARYRVNGFLAGVFSQQEWKEMNCFERCCWYWNWWNSKIENDLSDLSSSQRIRIKLEELKDNQNELFDFLELRKEKKEFRKVNQAYHETISKDKWSTDQIEKYQKWCSNLMQKWYGV